MSAAVRLLLQGADHRGRVRARRTGPAWLFGGAALLGAGLTAFYMTRLFVLTFHGPKRWTEDIEHPHESPPVMTIPLILLAVGSVGAGCLMSTSVPDWLSRPPVLGGRGGAHEAVLAARRDHRAVAAGHRARRRAGLVRCSATAPPPQPQPAGVAGHRRPPQPLHRRVQRGGLREARHLPHPGAGLPRQPGHRRAGQRARRRGRRRLRPAPAAADRLRPVVRDLVRCSTGRRVPGVSRWRRDRLRRCRWTQCDGGKAA